MPDRDLELTTLDDLKKELKRMEGVPKGKILGVVKWTDAAGQVFNRIFHEAAPVGGMAHTIEMEELKGTTEEAQRREIATVLKAGSEPVDWTVIRVKDGAGERDMDVLLHRPDGGVWARGLVQATEGLREAIVDVAAGEWEWFGKQEVNLVTGEESAPGKQEDSDEGSERVALYWREGVGKSGITGKDRNQFWSAAFISYVMWKAGAGALFRRSDHHQAYIYSAMVAARNKSSSYGYWGARLENRAPEVGDLICAWRKKKITFERAQEPGWYASHCDLVVAKTDTTVSVIGGNVGHSVTKRTFRLENGKITANTFRNAFAILENRMSAAAEIAVSAKVLDQSVTGQPKALPDVEFEPIGEGAPIRGRFEITAQQIEKLCTESRARYAVYAAATAESSVKFGLNPLFVLANFINQGVNSAYRNPWGISTDFYPFGPNGSQLGQPNGNVKNGPRKFGENEWRIAFDRQFAFVANVNGTYKNANTIAEWARIDAPPGAANDVHSTNAQHGRNVGELYDRLVGSLEAQA